MESASLAPAASVIGSRASARGITRSTSRRVLRLPSSADTRTETEAAELEDLLYGTTACLHLTKSARLQLARVASIRQYDRGSVLCSVGQPMSCVFFILQGQVSYLVNDDPDAAPFLLTTGSSLGTFQDIGPGAQEVALTPRTRQPPGANKGPIDWGGTATAVTDIEVAIVTQQQWAQLTQEDPTWDARQVAMFLEDVAVFGNLSRAQLTAVSRLVRVVCSRAGSVVYKQGAEGDDIYILRKGFVRLLRELQVESNQKQQINRLTQTMLGLRHSLEVLTSPRNAPPLPMLPVPPLNSSRTNSPVHTQVLSPTSPRPGSLSQISPSCSPRGSLGQIPGGPSPRGSYSNIKGNGYAPSTSSQPNSPSMYNHSPSRRQQCSNSSVNHAQVGHSTQVVHYQLEDCNSSNSLKPPGSEEGSLVMPSRSRLRVSIPNLDLSQLAPNSQTSCQPNSARQGGNANSSPAKGNKPAHASPSKAHLVEVRVVADKMLKRAASKRHLTGSATLTLNRDESWCTEETDNSVPSPAAGATEKLLQTIKSRRFEGVLPRTPNGDLEENTAATNPEPVVETPSPVKVSQVKPIETSGLPKASSVFTSATPRALGREQTFFVEMGLLSSGRIFGTCAAGDKSKKRQASAVADTHIEMLILKRSDVEVRLGKVVGFLWNQDAAEGKALMTDNAIRSQLERTMEWEVYKKQLLEDIFKERRTKACLVHGLKA